MIARCSRVLALCALLVAVAAPRLSAAANPQAIARLKAGEITEAKASWWGFDPVDSTKALQAAINSGAKRLVVENMGKPWIVTPLHLVSNQEIVFEKGTVVEAKKGEFKGKTDALMKIDLQENVTLIGYGATLRMHRWDYAKEPYEKAEWRHVLTIRSSKNIKVYGLTLAESGGDGIYLGKAKAGVTNHGVHIKDVVCDGNYRQGISVITARDLLIEKTVMKNTGGTPPQAGIDFEPNHHDEELVNCVMRDCVAEDNKGGGYVSYLPNITGKSAPISMRFENCIARGSNRVAFAFITGNEGEAGPVLGKAECINCTFEGGSGPGISVSRKPATGARLRFVKCRVIRPAMDRPAVAPISFSTRVGNMLDVGGVDFVDCVVEDPIDRPFFKYRDYGNELRLVDVTGTLVLRRQGKETTHTFTQKWLDALPGNKPLKRFPKYDMSAKQLVPIATPTYAGTPAVRPFKVRKKGAFVIHAAAGDNVAFALRHRKVGRYGGKPFAVKATTPSGKTLALGNVPFKAEATFTFKAAETGIYRVPIDATPNSFQITACNRPVCVSGERAAIHFIYALGDYYFFVPAGTKEFGVKVFGEGESEAIGVAVFDPSGKKVWEDPVVVTPEQYVGTPSADQTGKVWKIRFAAPKGTTMEDFHLQLQGIPPLISSIPQALLKPAN